MSSLMWRRGGFIKLLSHLPNGTARFLFEPVTWLELELILNINEENRIGNAMIVFYSLEVCVLCYMIPLAGDV